MQFFTRASPRMRDYAELGVPTTVMATTAWFILAEQFLNQFRIGPFAFVSSMLVQPVHPAAVAEVLAEAVVTPQAGDEVHLWGPEQMRGDDMARQLVRATGRKTRVIGVPYPHSEFRKGALLPMRDGIQGERRYADWLREHSTHAP